MVPWWDQYSAGQPREAVLILSHRESKPRFQADPQLRTIIQCPTRIVLPRGLRAVGMRIWSQAASSQWSHRGHRRLLRGGASIIQPGQRTPLRGADIHQSQPTNQPMWTDSNSFQGEEEWKKYITQDDMTLSLTRIENKR